MVAMKKEKALEIIKNKGNYLDPDIIDELEKSIVENLESEIQNDDEKRKVELRVSKDIEIIKNIILSHYNSNINLKNTYL